VGEDLVTEARLVIGGFKIRRVQDPLFQQALGADVVELDAGVWDLWQDLYVLCVDLRLEVQERGNPADVTDEVKREDVILALSEAESASQLLDQDPSAVGHARERQNVHVRDFNALVENVDGDPERDASRAEVEEPLLALPLRHVGVSSGGRSPLGCRRSSVCMWPQCAMVWQNTMPRGLAVLCQASTKASTTASSRCTRNSLLLSSFSEYSCSLAAVTTSQSILSTNSR
jgi:hypothetical protein